MLMNKVKNLFHLCKAIQHTNLYKVKEARISAYIWDHKRSPIAFLLQSEEKEEAYFELFENTKRYLDKVHGGYDL